MQLSKWQKKLAVNFLGNILIDRSPVSVEQALANNSPVIPVLEVENLLSKDKVWALISCQVSARVRVLLPSQMSCPVVENLMEKY